MKAIITLLYLLVASPALAQTIRVTSGEHDGFSRLVLIIPAEADWRMFRRDQGYELQLPGIAPRFALEEVYRRLSRTRLSAIYADPQSGGLALGIGCDCHALAYQLRAGVLVVDILEGPPPAGSSFEQSETGVELPPILASNRESPSLRPKGRPDRQDLEAGEDVARNPDSQNWRSAVREAAETPQSDLVEGLDPTLTEMRDALLWELSRNAAKGRIDIVTPPRTATPPLIPAAPDQIRIGDVPGMSTEADKTPGLMTEAGAECYSQDRVAISAWGSKMPPAQALGEMRAGLTGEFDRPELENVARAVKYLLYLGFGAEAHQMLDVLDISAPDRPLWEAMSYILDLAEPPEAVFEGMTNCDSDVALWAALSVPTLPSDRVVQRNAILRAFSALPLHLRHHLGPELAERFLAADDPATARAIKDAILRAQEPTETAVQLMDARIDLANGQDEVAVEKLNPLLERNDQAGVAAAIALAATQTKDGGVASTDLVTTLESFLAEGRNGPDAAALSAALALAYASQDRFEQAFLIAAPMSPAAEPVWQRLAFFGADTPLLDYGIQAGPQSLPPPDGARDLRIAERLIALGFGTEAMLWIAAGRQNPESDAARLLRAGAALQIRDGRAALRELAGLLDDEAKLLKGQALALLGDAEAVEVFLEANAIERALAVARQIGDWPQVASLDPSEPWSELAKGLLAPQVATELPPSQATDPAGPLGQGRLALQDSSAARDSIARLLSETFTARFVN
jgi:hypothetical protein